MCGRDEDSRGQGPRAIPCPGTRGDPGPYGTSVIPGSVEAVGLDKTGVLDVRGAVGYPGPAGPPGRLGPPVVKSRLGRDDRFVLQALVASTGGTCSRRRVGCVLVDARGHVLSTGCNGPASGEFHCIDTPCEGASAPSGTGLDACRALHGEQNALLQCRDVYAVDVCYCTTAPCLHCVKLLMNTSCRRVVFLDTYPHAEASERLWRGSRGAGSWLQYRAPTPKVAHLVEATRQLLELTLG